MLFAKHGYAMLDLINNYKSKTIEKRYYALVSGQGELEDEEKSLRRLLEMKIVLSRRVHRLEKYAHTSYRVVERFGDVALVDIRLHTGRTHQIRVHFAHIGFPLLGDDLYGGRMDLGITRQACIAIIYVL